MKGQSLGHAPGINRKQSFDFFRIFQGISDRYRSAHGQPRQIKCTDVQLFHRLIQRFDMSLIKMLTLYVRLVTFSISQQIRGVYRIFPDKILHHSPPGKHSVISAASMKKKQYLPAGSSFVNMYLTIRCIYI